jgi:hypothetical protein
MVNTWPADTARVPVALDPFPPAPPVAPLPPVAPAPPSAPSAVKLIEVTPVGTVKVCAPPVKLKVVVVGVTVVKVGVTVIVAVTGNAVALVALKLAMLPLPLAARPIDGVLLTQLNVVPATGLVKFTAAVGELLQTVWFGTGFTLVQAGGAL